MFNPILAASVTLAVVLLALYRVVRRSTIRHIRGPPPPSLLFGHEEAIITQDEVGDLEFKYLREYGPTWKLGGNFGTDVLMTADPKAMQHIYHKSGYNYLKRASQNQVGTLLSGPGIVAAPTQESHQRHRKSMNPAFSLTHLRTFVPVFRRLSNKLADKLKEELSNSSTGETDVMVNKWLSRATLDIIGETAFDFQYDALDNGNSRISRAYENLFKDISYKPSGLFSLFVSVWDYLPQPLLDSFRCIPLHPFTRIRQMHDLYLEYGKQILREQRATTDVEKMARSKDVMSLLIRANGSADAKTRLSDAELLAEMFTLTLAGHETTSSTLTFLLYELSRHPEYQDRMREEIREVRAQVTARGDNDFTIEDMDKLTLTMHAIKETLRFHAIVSALPRIASKDDVIPLQYPVVSETGETVTEVPVRAGQVIYTSFAAYHRLTDIWGADANEWNPDRWFRPDMGKQTSVGVFSNLMTFSAGVRACIGWRFSVIEMQTILYDLVEKFRFSLPAENMVIKRAPAGLIMIPIVVGKEELNVAMPLRLSLVQY
ncbi:cytochrome P450 [Daedaleopsis nitida]|nr:cytochrome P450 [Daedaleopsis nitida]